MKSKAMHVKPYKVEALVAAKELGYGEAVIKRIDDAKTDGEIERIMRTARKEKYGV